MNNVSQNENPFLRCHAEREVPLALSEVEGEATGKTTIH